MDPNSVSGVHEWLIALLQTGNGATVSLRLCMKVGDEHAGNSIFDSSGERHRYGDAYYEDAHLLALRQAVEVGRIEPACDNDEQRTAWDRWMAGDPLNGSSRVPVLEIELKYVRGPIDEETDDTRTPHQRATEYLMGLLKAEGHVRYSRFYDGTTATEDLMRRVCGLEDGDDSAESLMDDVVWDLGKAGVVRTTELPQELSDGNNDYLIELIEAPGD